MTIIKDYNYNEPQMIINGMILKYKPKKIWSSKCVMNSMILKMFLSGIILNKMSPEIYDPENKP